MNEINVKVASATVLGVGVKYWHKQGQQRRAYTLERPSKNPKSKGVFGRPLFEIIVI